MIHVIQFIVFFTETTQNIYSSFEIHIVTTNPWFVFSPCEIYTSQLQLQMQLQKCVVLKADYTWTNIYKLSIFYDWCWARHGVPISTQSVFTYKRILTFDFSKSYQYNNISKTYSYIHHTCIYYKNCSWLLTFFFIHSYLDKHMYTLYTCNNNIFCLFFFTILDDLIATI